MPEVKDLGLANNEIVSVQRTSGTGKPGSVDTYTITVRDGTSFAFNVTNGNNGLSGLSRDEFTFMAAFTSFLDSNMAKVACIVYRYLDGDSINHYYNVMFGLGMDSSESSTKVLKYMDSSGNWQSITTLSENASLIVYYFKNAVGVAVVPTSRTIAGLSLESDITENALFDKMSIKGRYATLTALQDANPNHGYCYLVEANNHWYYHDGAAWTDGGLYNSTAFESDKTLTVSGAAADAKVTGDRLKTISDDVTNTINQVTITDGELIVNYVSGATDNLGKINAYDDVIVVNSETNTTEIANNVEVGGNLQVNGIFKNIENIVDSAGRRRFFDMPLTLSETLINLGLRMTYGKIGLSGNHLSIVAVIANKSDSTITIPKSSTYAYVVFGQSENSWVVNKIYPLGDKVSPNGYFVAKANAAKILSGWNLPMTSVDNIALEKTSNNARLLITSTNLTESAVELPSKASLRITVDLLIDFE